MKLNTLDANKVKAEIESRIKRMEQDLAITETILDVLKKYEGKKPTRRICNDLKARPEMAGYVIYRDASHGMYHITIWGNGIEYGQRYSILIGYKDSHQHANDIILMEQVHEFAKCHTLDRERIDKIRRNMHCLEGWINDWNKSIAVVNLAYEAFTEIYGFYPDK